MNPLDMLQPTSTSTVAAESAFGHVRLIREALKVVEVWSTGDDNWRATFARPRPHVVDASDACRLDRVWPDRDEHVLTVSGILAKGYLHFLFSERPLPREIWAIIALEGLHIELLLGRIPLQGPATNC